MPEEAKTDNITLRLWLETLESVIGVNGVKSLLNYSHLEKYIESPPPDNDNLDIAVEDLHRLYLALLELFGRKGARSLQLRIGKEFIRIGVTKRPTIAGALKLSTRLLPGQTRISLALKKFAEEYDRRQPSPEYSPRIEIREEEDCFLLIDKDNFESKGITSDTPMCATCVGRLQYLMEWITGHTYDIREIECRAMGDQFDVFRVPKTPVEED
ncbi:MAG: hypothetical protein HXS49_10350 [Theionarchaea archaeon]|nr:hypothetical protein [Theionarchaea archaeon]MBU7035581.1 hypothetical protein [Theionarchaea archaeon]MBU7041226.1 hypothetical protein [Theionarchaea archaeon]